MNSVNNLKPKTFLGMRQAAFDVTMTNTMYLRKSYSIPTKLTRRRWSRRKHLYGWLPLANVLKDWARAYRFYRNYNKVSFNQHLTKNSFLAFSLINVKNSLPCLHANSELLVSGTFSQKIFRYFSHFSNTRLQFFSSFRNINLSVISFEPRYSPPASVKDYPFVVPLLNHHMTLTESYKVTRSRTENSLTPLLTFLANTTFSTIQIIYKILILLTLSRLR